MIVLSIFKDQTLKALATLLFLNYDEEIKGGVYKLKYKWENPFKRVGRCFFKIPSNTLNFYIEYNSQYTIKASHCLNLKNYGYYSPALEGPTPHNGPK